MWFWRGNLAEHRNDSKCQIFFFCVMFYSHREAEWSNELLLSLMMTVRPFRFRLLRNDVSVLKNLFSFLHNILSGRFVNKYGLLVSDWLRYFHFSSAITAYISTDLNDIWTKWDIYLLVKHSVSRFAIINILISIRAI